MTIHKSQGINAEEGTIVSFKGAKMPKPVAQLGFAFVAWTRATLWSKMGFESLPPLEDFLAVRQQKAFQARCVFEVAADDLHDAFLLRRRISAQQQLEDHRQHLRKSLLESSGREPTDLEFEDLAAMLRTRGVLPLSESVRAWMSGHVGRTSGSGLTAMLTACRRDRALRDAGDVRTKPAKKKNDAETWATIARRTATELLRAMGFEEAVAQDAFAHCGPSVSACLDFCLTRTSAPVFDSATEKESSVAADPATPAPFFDGAVDEAEQFEAAEAFVQLGFSQTAITRALETVQYSFPKALQLLLHGNDVGKWKAIDANKRFHRHLRTRIPQIDNLCGNEVRDQYTLRAGRDLGIDVRVVDLDQKAGKTTAACFWLCLAAGLVAGGEPTESQSLTAFPAIASLWHRATGRCPTVWHDLGGAAIQNSSIGELAEALRACFCQGSSALLLRPAVMARIFPAFACLNPHGPPRTLVHYRAWVQKVGTKEYADELILAAVARELQVRIVVVPWTPSNSVAPWSITSYPDRDLGQPDLPIIYMGNNDVHYVWLALPL